jgi:hypothetical protein
MVYIHVKSGIGELQFTTIYIHGVHQQSPLVPELN